ncbi:hypothetical protein NC652_000467 [Populus alba x Populus x berolinensis]|nr:hypothetical protein NC652_000467 [Populus alba x Populus x berolinensis]
MTGTGKKTRRELGISNQMEARDQQVLVTTIEFPSFDSFACSCCQRGEETKNSEKKGVSVPGQIHERNLQFDTHTPFSVLKSILLLILRNEQTTGSSQHLVNIAMCMEPACLALSLLSKTNYE